VQKLLKITLDYQSADDLVTEDQQLAFIKAFREIIRHTHSCRLLSNMTRTRLSLINSILPTLLLSMSTCAVMYARPLKKEKVSVLDDVDF